MIPGLAEWVKDPVLLHSCNIGHRCGSDPVLLWLCRRPAAAAPIPPLAQERPYAVGAALKVENKIKNLPQFSSGAARSFLATNHAPGPSPACPPPQDPLRLSFPPTPISAQSHLHSTGFCSRSSHYAHTLAPAFSISGFFKCQILCWQQRPRGSSTGLLIVTTCNTGPVLEQLKHLLQEATLDYSVPLYPPPDT